MKATRPARALAWTAATADRFWGPLVLMAVATPEVAVFAPQQMIEAMQVGGCVGAGAMVVGLFSRAG